MKQMYLRRNNATVKGNQRDHVKNAKPPPTFSYWCRNLKSKNTTGEQNPWSNGRERNKLLILNIKQKEQINKTT
jgi:hypothetical protein